MVIIMNFDSQKILTSFPFEGEFISAKTIDEGLINTTFVFNFEKQKYIVQKINTDVFQSPDKLMQNIMSVTRHLTQAISKKGENPHRQTLNFLHTNDANTFFKDENGDCWRSYVFLDDCYTVGNSCSKDEIYEAAKAFGKFQFLLNDFPSKNLHETIKDFHNTPKRFDALYQAIKQDRAGRAQGVKKEIEFFIERKNDTSRVVNLIKSGALPLRVTHNDTKINNVLFDKATKKASCVIDLDTIMPGSSLYDFGDGIRTSAATAQEDEPQTEKMGLDLEVYEAYTSGYLEGTNKELTETEIELLPFSVKLLTLEVAMRFLTDYLNGDIYFKTKYDDHNLVRTRAQIALIKDVESKLSSMERITAKTSGRV